MVARIAPSPITTSVAIGDAINHAVPSPSTGNGRNSSPHHEYEPQVAINSGPSAPLPPSPPGEAFAAAVIAGQLAPRPVTPDQLRQRLGSAWQPPASPLRLMDRNV
jgi:hypothetical protein